MSADFLMMRSCPHVNGTYTSANCPVCSGVNYFFDITLTQNGDLQKITGVDKVVQEIVHMFKTDEGEYSDYGYSDYGSRINRFIGSKNNSEVRLRFQVLRDIEYITKKKERQHRKFSNITVDEVIQQIVSIDIENTVDEQKVKLSAVIGGDDNLKTFTAGLYKLT